MSEMRRQATGFLRELFRPVAAFLREMLGVALMGVGLTMFAMADLTPPLIAILLLTVGVLVGLMGGVMANMGRDERPLRERLRATLKR